MIRSDFCRHVLVLVLLGLLLPVVLAAQETFPYLVKIHGTPKPGSGFVVARGPGIVTIVTAAHVVMGASRFEVAFAIAPGQRFAVDWSSDFVGMQSDEIHGLAAFRVRGSLPAPVAALPIDTETTLALGEDQPLVFVGYPNRARSPRRMTGSFAGREGFLLLVDRSVGQGASGGPLLLGAQVVGLVTAADANFTYAVDAVVVLEALKGWGVQVGERSEEPCSLYQEETFNGIVFVRICAGNFRMGSTDGAKNEKPVHKVTLSEFWIGKYEITNAQHRPDHTGDAKLPVTRVSWSEAKAFCESLGPGFQLPTEAQWEYAARAGTQTAWSFGDDESDLGDHAWFRGNSEYEAHPVGEKEANGWGLHDMHGNVWEWVGDGYASYNAEAQTDPKGPESPPDALRVLRGGSFNYGARWLHSAYRFRRVPENRSVYVGFRCVRIPRLQP